MMKSFRCVLNVSSIGFLSATLFGGLSVTKTIAAEKMNIVFILADDLGWKDLGCYGSSFNETPHIDALARSGVRFTQAYTAGAVCSPTRSSIMAGRVPARTGVTDYIPGLSSNGKKLSTKPTALQMKLDEVTIAETLKESGYQTFYAGKWHLGEANHMPKDQGFEVSVLDSDLGNHGKDWQVGKRLTESAVKFLDDRDKSRPFFMFLGYHEPHTPILEYPDHIAHFKEKAKGLSKSESTIRRERQGQTRTVQDDPVYASEVAGLDHFVGQVLDALHNKSLDKKTIVVFFSDNGGLSTKAEPGPTSNEPLRAGKGWLYEGGIRVPCIVRVPEVSQAGSTEETPILSTDFYPTLLDLVGVNQKPDQHCDGTSFAAKLTGVENQAKPTDMNRRPLCWHYPHYHGSTWAPGGAIREGDWKLIEFFEEERAELYNLASDLSEKENVVDQYSEIANRLKSELATWRKSVGAVMPERNPDFSKYEHKVPWITPDTAIATASKNQKSNNFVEDNVKPWILPPLMRDAAGKELTSNAEWRERRSQLLDTFRTEMFGVSPPRPIGLKFETVNHDPNAMNGAATLTQTEISFPLGDGVYKFNLTQFVPNERTGPVPAFLLLNHRGPENTDPTRQTKLDFWPAEYVVGRGFAMAAINVAHEVDPDDAKNTSDGVRAFYRKHHPQADQFTWGALAAWAWSGSRALDYFETEPAIDETRIAVIGHSRTGKTALWAAASDERFALACVNGAGEGGPAIIRRNFGETLKQITSRFPHWFTPKYSSYADRVDELPFDSHMLIALVAPRGYHGGDGTTDLWADPRGSWLGLVAASPAWEITSGTKRFDPDLPLVNDLVVNGPLAYHIHDGGHALEVFDWKLYVDHAEQLFDIAKKANRAKRKKR